MKTLTNLIGILLIIFGIVSLGYRGITYNKQEEVAKLGDIKVTANTEKTVSIPPLVGGASLVAGIILVLAGRLGRK